MVNELKRSEINEHLSEEFCSCLSLIPSSPSLKRRCEDHDRCCYFMETRDRFPSSLFDSVNSELEVFSNHASLQSRLFPDGSVLFLSNRRITIWRIDPYGEFSHQSSVSSFFSLLFLDILSMVYPVS